ncbi:hypothetical protein PsorP6_013267 [Peronosclerospora sorghi]|uniref:Uncharacterized protein n=1 Tax=Peronosclerospora sorghi TaxID=230839 RepID=A0ACC0WGB4_9STRA|nr:hypothetical protein PsorP6_013267 [Peronosclerospora sorghi]
MTRRVRVLGTERRAKRVDVRECTAVGFDIELARDTQEGRTREKVDEQNLGEVRLSLAMPRHETFTDSYPLICRSNGVKRRSMHVGLHRFVLTSSLLLDAAKTLGERSLA